MLVGVGGFVMGDIGCVVSGASIVLGGIDANDGSNDGGGGVVGR